MASESIAHQAEDRMGYRLRDHEDKRIIVLAKSSQLVEKVSREHIFRYLKVDKRRFSRHCFGFHSRRFSLLVDYNIQPSSSSTNQNGVLKIDHQLDFTKYISTYTYACICTYIFSLCNISFTQDGFSFTLAKITCSQMFTTQQKYDQMQPNLFFSFLVDGVSFQMKLFCFLDVTVVRYSELLKLVLERGKLVYIRATLRIRTRSAPTRTARWRLTYLLLWAPFQTCQCRHACVQATVAHAQGKS